MRTGCRLLAAGFVGLSACGAQSTTPRTVSETTYAYDGQTLRVENDEVIHQLTEGGDGLYLSSRDSCESDDYSCELAAFPFAIPKSGPAAGVAYATAGYEFDPACMVVRADVCDIWIIRFRSSVRTSSEVADQGFFVYEPNFGVRAFARFGDEQGSGGEMLLGPIWSYDSGAPFLAAGAGSS